MGLPPLDFESSASTYFTTPASFEIISEEDSPVKNEFIRMKGLNIY
jgi:hypothetical protein